MKATREEACVKEKHGIKLWVYPTASEGAGVVYIEVEGDTHYYPGMEGRT